MTSGKLMPTMPMVEDFVSHMSSVSGIMQAQSAKDLLSAMSNSLKKIFKAIRVVFLLQCKDTIDLLKNDKVEIKSFNHSHTTFHVPVPDNVKKANFEVTIQFKNLADVMKGKVFTGRIAVGPVFKIG